jgi:hypothetical protein
LSVEREIARNTAFQLGYVGNSGIHLTSGIDVNAVPVADWAQSAFTGGSNLNAFRPADNFGQILQFEHNGKASYHSLQALFRSRLSNFSSFQASYTYSHSIGNVQLDNSSGSVNSQAVTDQADGGLDKGNTNINRPHIFVANEVFFLPKLLKHGALVQNTLGGWELNSIISVESGASLSIFSSGASGALGSSLNSLQGSGFTSNNRPDIVPGVGCDSGQSGRQILNPNAFTFTGYVIGTVGNTPRGYCFGPTNRNVDMQLAKNWMFKERFRVKFSLDFFNLFNHANFGGGNLEGMNYNASNLVCGASSTACTPANNVISGFLGGASGNPNSIGSGFGQSNSVQPGREIQYALKFTF